MTREIAVAGLWALCVVWNGSLYHLQEHEQLNTMPRVLAAAKVAFHAFVFGSVTTVILVLLIAFGVVLISPAAP